MTQLRQELDKATAKIAELRESLDELRDEFAEARDLNERDQRNLVKELGEEKAEYVDRLDRILDDLKTLAWNMRP